MLTGAIPFYRNVLFLYVLAFAVNSITLLVIRYNIEPTSQTLALHYNVLSGVDLYGRGTNLYLVPFVGYLLLLLNVVFTRLIGHRDGFMAELVAGFTVATELVLLGAVGLLARIN